MKKLFIILAIAVMTVMPAMARTVVIVQTSCGKTVIATTEESLSKEQAAVVAAVADYLYC